MLLLVAVACEQPTPSVLTGVTVERLGPTVARVSWSTETAGIGFVRFAQPDDPVEETRRDPEPTTEHEFVVAGMTASEHWRLTAVTSIDGEDFESIPLDFATNAIPMGGAEVGASEGTLVSTPFLMQTTLGSSEGVVIYDRHGEIVWELPVPLGRFGARARLDPSGATVTVGEFDETLEANAIVTYGLDGRELERRPAPMGHHDFDRIPGGFAYLAADVRGPADKPVVGDTIVEIDDDGNETARPWSAWDAWRPKGHEVAGVYESGLDWTHANTLEYVASTDQYMVSIHNLNAVIFVDRASGTIVRQIGGPAATHALAAGTAFALQHSPMIRDDELVLLDNGGAGVSAARGYQLDDVAHTYTESWSIQNPANATVLMLGDVFRTASGATLTSWGSSGVIAEHDANGEPTFRLDLALGSAFGFFEPIAELGGPSPD